MQRFIQDLGVLTGSEQNDMFFCRNPSVSATRTNFNTVMDVESLSDSESAHVSPSKTSEISDHPARNVTLETSARESLEVPERSRKLSSSSRKGSIDKSIRKTMKKKVSFDKGQSYNLLEESKEEAEAEKLAVPRHKRSLPRQEIAVDIESPISNKKLSNDYPIPASEGKSAANGQTVVSVANDANGQSHQKKRKLGKNRKLAKESASMDSSQSSEVSSFGSISHEGTDQSNVNTSPGADNNLTRCETNSKDVFGLTMIVPNLVVKATITEKSDSFGPGTNYDVQLMQTSPNMSSTPSSKKLGKPQKNKSDKPKCEGTGSSSDTSSPMIERRLLHECSESDDTDSHGKSSNLLLPPTDEGKNKKGVLRKLQGKVDRARWSCSELDSSKETSL